MSGYIEVTSKKNGIITRTLTYLHVEDGRIVIDREIETTWQETKLGNAEG